MILFEREKGFEPSTSTLARWPKPSLFPGKGGNRFTATYTEQCTVLQAGTGLGCDRGCEGGRLALDPLEAMLRLAADEDAGELATRDWAHNFCRAAAPVRK